MRDRSVVILKGLFECRLQFALSSYRLVAMVGRKIGMRSGLGTSKVDILILLHTICQVFPATAWTL